jgi:hypothetical protein
MRCKTPGCRYRGRSRGLCPNCLAQAKRYVDVGVVSWAQLEAAGLTIPDNVGDFKSAFKATLPGMYELYRANLRPDGTSSYRPRLAEPPQSQE